MFLLATEIPSKVPNLDAIHRANELLVSIPAEQRKPALPEFHPRHSMASDVPFGERTPSERRQDASERDPRTSIATPSRDNRAAGPSGTSTPASLRRVIVNRKQRLNGGTPAQERFSTASSISMSIDSGSAHDSTPNPSSSRKPDSPSIPAKSPMLNKTFSQRRKSRFSLGEVFSVRPSRRREPLDLGLGDMEDAENAGDDSGLLPMDEETEEGGDSHPAAGLISPEEPADAEGDEFDMEMTGEDAEVPSPGRPPAGRPSETPRRPMVDDPSGRYTPAFGADSLANARQHERFISGWEIEKSEQDLFEMGKSYYETKELERCYEMLGRCKSKKAKFLRLYSKYLVRVSACCSACE
jgi:hypothetical protein